MKERADATNLSPEARLLASNKKAMVDKGTTPEELRLIDLSGIVNAITEDQKTNSGFQGKEGLEKKYAKELDLTGLAIEIEQLDENQVQRLALSNPRLFIAYLCSFAQDSTPEAQRKSVDRLCQLFIEELVRDEQMSPEASTLLQTLLPFRKELKYGASHMVNGLIAMPNLLKLDDFLKAAEKGYLPKFFLAYKTGIFNGVFNKLPGPEQWHVELPDIESYKANWQRVIEVVKTISEDDTAIRLAQFSVTVLRAGLERSQRDVMDRAITQADRSEKQHEIFEERMEINSELFKALEEIHRELFEKARKITEQEKSS